MITPHVNINGTSHAALAARGLTITETKE